MKKIFKIMAFALLGLALSNVNAAAKEPAVTDIAISGDLYVGTELTFTATVANFSAEPMVIYEVKAEGDDYKQAQGGKFTPTAVGNYTVKATAFYQPEEGDAEEASKEVNFTVAAEAPAKHDYTINVYLPEFPDEIDAYGDSVRVVGAFDNWGDGVEMGKSFDEDFKIFYYATLNDVAEGTEFKLRFGTDESVQVKYNGVNIDSEYTGTETTITLRYDGSGYSFTVPAPTLNAYEDPANKGTFYVTFYSGTAAYKVPQTATAFAVSTSAGKAELVSVGGTIAAGVPVLIKSTQAEVVLTSSEEPGAKPAKNDLKGSDTAIKSAGPGIKAFTLGQNGVGFYSWEGKPIPANKAYLNVK